MVKHPQAVVVDSAQSGLIDFLSFWSISIGSVYSVLVRDKKLTAICMVCNYATKNYELPNRAKQPSSEI